VVLCGGGMGAVLQGQWMVCWVGGRPMPVVRPGQRWAAEWSWGSGPSVTPLDNSWRYEDERYDEPEE
jgi:hypothetical protein